MNTVYYSIFFVSVVQLLQESNCIENNVCETIQDYYTIKNNSNCAYDVAADPSADPVDIITSYGYLAEIHKVITFDGYILTMFRIPNNHVASKKGPVFLQHGIWVTSACFLGLGKHSLAFVLADAGYDVWLGNFRGTKYSEEHVNLTASDEQYWDYSIDEIGLYDIPAQLGYVSQATGSNRNIVYIGHSLGTISSLMYASTFPEESRRTIKLLILLAPAASIPEVKAPLFKLARFFVKPLLKIAQENNLLSLLSRTKTITFFTKQICFNSPLSLQRCSDAGSSLMAGPHTQIDTKNMPVAFNQLPVGSSLKVVDHAVDLTIGFRRYNYGAKNIEVYGSYKPPTYELNRIQVPVFMVYAINDYLLTPKTALTAYRNLPPKMRYGIHKIKVPNFNHGDFLWGRNAKTIVYDIVLQVLDNVE